MTKSSVVFLYLLISAASMQTKSSSATFTIRDLGTFGGRLSDARGSNNAGTVIGSSQDMNDNYRAFTWTQATGAHDIGTIGGPASYGTDINESNQMSGYSFPSGTLAQHPTFWNADEVPFDMGVLPGRKYGEADAINESGRIVGKCYGNGYERMAFSWTSALGMTPLRMLSNGLSSNAADINDLGEVAGYGMDLAGKYHALYWKQDGTPVDLGAIIGGVESYAYGINNQGRIVGFWREASGQEHAFVWSEAEGLKDLGGLGGTIARAMGVNELGQVVGWSDLALGSSRGFFWAESNGMVDLGILAGGTYSQAFDINDNGLITGRSTISNERHAVVWQPVPEPSSLLSLLCGLGGVGGILYRRRK